MTKVRNVTIYNGEIFLVPQGIQRIDTKSTHGWQVRYHGTKMFSDNMSNGQGAKQALAMATRELLDRIAACPAPVSLQRSPSANKTSNLPSGISGPITRRRRGSETSTASLSVLLPRFGNSPKHASVYIGTENTYTQARFGAAVARAIELRHRAEEQYELDATRSKRQQGKLLLAAIQHV